MNTTPFIRHCAVGLAAAAVLLTGCENMSEREKGTVQGGAIGAVGGAVIGAATGGNAGTAAAIGGAVGAIAGNLWSKKQEDRRKQMEQATQGTGVDVTRTADNQLKINVPNDVSFDINSAAIKPQLRTVLDSFASSLQGDPKAEVNIIGHTDSTGTAAINNPLSLERAQSGRDYLSGRGVSPSRIQTAGRGDREPVASNANEAGRAQNRRVEIFIREPA